MSSKSKIILLLFYSGVNLNCVFFFLNNNKCCFIPSELCESASCGEVFLLASAALANITFFDSMACEILLQLNAIHILLQACKDKQRVDTPYSKDQVQSDLGSVTRTGQQLSLLCISFIFVCIHLWCGVYLLL